MSRKKKPEHANHERWLVSYADFITLLFAFFVVLYASSQVDKNKMGQLAASIEAAFQDLGVFQGGSIGPAVNRATPPRAAPAKPRAEEIANVAEMNRIAEREAATEKMRQQVAARLAEEIRRHAVDVRKGPDGVIISLREVGFFNSGSAQIRPDARPAFSQVAEVLREADCGLRIEGHTDNVPIHNAQFSSNWELSTSRATEVIKLLMSGYNFSPQRLSAAGYAEFHPVAPNTTSEGRAQNRRIDIVILSPNLR